MNALFFCRRTNPIFMVLSFIFVIAAAARGAADDITGVTVANYSSQLPGVNQGCCDRHASYLVTGTGLDVNGPGTATTTPDGGNMWLSDLDVPPLDPSQEYVTFDLGAVYDLDGTRIWNYNEPCCLNRGVYELHILVSSDNVTYRDLGVYVLARAPGDAYRDYSQYLELHASDVRYVQFDVLSSWDDTNGDNYVGLSKVRFVAAPDDEAPVASGLILHLDASDTDGDGNPANEPGVGETVSTWVDKSGQGNNATASGVPTLSRDALNGHPAIRFNGSAEFALPNLSGLTAGEAFVVVKSDQYPPLNPAETGLWDMGTGTLQTHYSWVNGRIYDNFGTDTRNENIETTLVLDQWNVYNASSVPGTWYCAVNGVPQRTRGGNTVTFPAAPAIGRSFSGINFYGQIAEVLLYNRGLTPSERNQVNDYLYRRYDLGANYNDPDAAPPETKGILLHYDASMDGQVGNGGALPVWNDRSGSGIEATALGDPQWVRNSLGGNPAIRFDGVNDEYIIGTLTSLFPTGGTVFIATSLNDVHYNLFSTATDRDEWWRYDGNGYSYPSTWHSPRVEFYAPMPSAGEFLFTVESTPAFWQMYQDSRGKGAVAAAYSPGNEYRISSSDNNAVKRLAGDISEIIVYDRALSTEKKSAVEAYLNKKYRINSATSALPVTNGRVLHLAADAIPDAVNGGVVTGWNDISASGLTATAVGDPVYRDNWVNGKPVIQFNGNDSFSVPLSTSNTMTIFTVIRGSNYQSMMRWQPGNWIVYPWGNGNLIQTTNGGTAEASSLNAGLVPDEWNIATAVINTGATNGVKTYRNGILKGQKTYSAWGNLSPLWIGSINGGGEFMISDLAEVIVYHRALDDNERRSVERYLAEKYGLDGRGPGGLEKSDLELWLRADKDVVADTSNFVAEWGDQSGFNRYVYQDATTQRPDWIPNSQNGLPVLRFNPNAGTAGTVEYFKSDGIWPGGASTSVGASLYFAAKSNINDTFGYQSILRYQGGTWLILPWYNQMILNEDSGTSGVNAGLLPLQWNIAESTYRANTVNGFQTFSQGSLVAQKTSQNIVLGSNELLVGACCGTSAINGESPNADVGEVISYSERLNDARRVLLQNYLSARFDTALNANDVYTGDTNGAGDYDWDLAGIGRSGNPVDFGDGANALGAGRHLLGNSAGFVVEEVSFLNDSGDYIVVAHNGAPNDLTNADLAGSGAQNRWNRVWYLQKTDANGNGGLVNLAFDISDGNPGGLNSGDMVLLRRAGTSGAFSVIATTPSVVGDQYGFTVNASTLSNAYYTVAEVDTTRPTITLVGNAVVQECGNAFVDPGYSANDNSDGDLTGSVVLTGSVNANQPGNYLLRYNVADSSGNTATERTRLVIVQDTQSPVITRIGAQIVTVECGSVYVDAGATAFDLCDGALTVVVGGLPVNTSVQGSKLLTYNVTDNEGLVATQVTRTVNVVDTIGPNITVNGGNPILECGVDTYTELGASATDACDGTVPVTIGGDTVNTSAVGVYTVTYNATDGANLAPQKTRTVTVQDTLGPVITLNGSPNVTVVKNQPYVELGANALDACEGSVAVSIGGAVVDTSTLGIYTVTYNAQDSGGRPATQKSRTVTVIAGNPPVITLLGADPFTMNCGDSYTDAGATATDPEDGSRTAFIVTVNPVNTQVAGTYTVTYDVVDTSGNPASQVTRTVNVEDNAKPVVTLLGLASDTVQCGAVYSDPGATASDACDDDTTLTNAIQVNNSPPDTSSTGVRTISYFVTDIAGNTSDIVSRTVTVVDTTPPVLNLLGAGTINLECGDVYSDLGATATDTCSDDASLTSSIVVGGLPIPTGTPGLYQVTYNVSDDAGNAATQLTRNVVVSDTESPTISLNGAPDLLIVLNGTYTELGASATDDCEGDLPVTIGGDVVNTAVEDVYIVTYDAQDSAGNDALQVTRRVFVTEGVAPFISDEPQDQVVAYSQNAVFTLTAVSVTTPTYSWRKDGVPLTNGSKYQGVLTNTLTVLAAENADEGQFSCLVTGEVAFTESVSALLTVQDPGITLQPVSQFAGVGDTVVFTSAALGSGTLAYQWYFKDQPLSNGGDISGADTNTLTIANAQDGADEGLYYVVVDGGLDPAIESDRALLTIGNPIIIQSPLSLVVPVGATAQFSVTASGAPPLLYRWRKNGSNLVDGGRFSGVATATLTITNAQLTDAATYDCRVIGQNIIESSAATLTVLGPPIIGGVVVLPETGVATLGGPLALTVLVTSGIEPFTYQWRKDGVPLSDSGNISGANAVSMNITAMAPSDAGYYDCVVANTVGSATSAPTLVQVGLTVAVDLQPLLAEVGSRATWRIQVEGAEFPPVYEWLKDDGSKTFQPVINAGPISGADTSTLVFDPVDYSDAGTYAVTVTDGTQVVSTSPAQLVVVASLPGPSYLILAAMAAFLAAIGAWLTQRRAKPRA